MKLFIISSLTIPLYRHKFNYISKKGGVNIVVSSWKLNSVDVIVKKIVNFSSKELYTQKNVSFSDILLDNKFTIVNIWSSWCLPCRDEHKYLIKLGQKNNLNMVGINYKDDPTNAKKFIDQFGNPFSLILIDKDGTIAIEWGAYGVPESFLLYKNKIIKKIIGPIDQNTLIEVKELIQ